MIQSSKLKVGIFSESKALFEEIKKAIPTRIAETLFFSEKVASKPNGLAIAFLDGKSKSFKGWVEDLAETGSYTVVVMPESLCSEDVPHLLQEGIVDDLLLTPIRSMEVVGKLNHASYLSRIKDLVTANANLSDLILRFEEDLKTARSIQKNLIPEKFPPVHGLSVRHKYVGGFKSGGDYLDFFEFEDKNHVGILMTDSTGYGLSAALMSMVLKLSMKISSEEYEKPSLSVQKIMDELRVTMKPNENLSIFYGILNRKTFELKFTSAGSIGCVRYPKTDPKKIEHIKTKLPSLSKQEETVLKDHSIQVLPEDRLVLFSDGFSDAYNGEDQEILNILKKCDDPIEIINDFTFRLKSKLSDADDLPDQDSSVMIIDVEKKILRIAKGA